MAKLILWAILIFFIVRALSRLLQGVLQGAGYRRDAPQQQSVGLVRDPVCGVFVVPGQALELGYGDVGEPALLREVPPRVAATLIGLPRPHHVV